MALRPPAPPAAPVEAKVKAATAGAGLSAAAVSAIVYALLTSVWPHLDQPAKVAVSAAAPGVLAAAVTFWSGYKARHTPRPVPAAPPQPSA